jgi:hypothetical protein
MYNYVIEIKTEIKTCKDCNNYPGCKIFSAAYKRIATIATPKDFGCIYYTTKEVP